MATRAEDAIVMSEGHVVISEGQLENIEQQEQASLSPSHQENVLHLFIIGKTRVGKSTLVNSMLGQSIDKKAKVTDGPNPTNHKPVEKHIANTGDRDYVVIYDTKGLSDPKLNNKSLLKEFGKVIEADEIDIVLICHTFTEGFDDSTIDTVKLLVQHFGKTANIWERCIFVLTKANNYYFDDDDEEDDAIKMAKVMTEWAIQFNECLLKHGVLQDTASRIPVGVAGTRKHLELPVTRNWIGNLFEMCIARCPSTDERETAKTKRLKKEAQLRVLKATAIGTAVGGMILPIAGAPIGFTIGGLIQWNHERKAYKLKQM